MKRLSALKTLLDEQGITYKEMAKSLGISTVTLSNKINGKYPFTLLEAEQIIDILGIAKSDEKCKLFNL